MGCVSYSQRFFPDGEVTAERMAQARLAAGQELQGISRLYCTTGWQEAYGSSGTAQGLITVLADGGMSKGGITLACLQILETKRISDGRVVIKDWPALKKEREHVMAG